MKKEGQNASSLITVLLALPFLDHILVLERYRNGFLEYDRHYWPLVLCAAFLVLFFRILVAPPKKYIIRPDIFFVLGGGLVLYILIRLFIADPTDLRGVIFPMVLLAFFFFYKYANAQLALMSICFIVATLIIAIIDIFDIQLIQGVFFLKDAKEINPGENANYYASAIPFLFSLLSWKRPISVAKFLDFALKLLALLACSYALMKCNARTAGIATLCGLVIVLQKMPALSFKRVRLRRWSFLGVLFVLMGALSLFMAAKAIYNRNPKSIQGRFFIYEVTADLIAQRPLIGHGPQSFKRLYNIHQSDYIREHKIANDTLLLADNCYFAFNEFLQIHAELGVTGLLIVLATLYFCLKIFQRNDLDKFEIGAIASLMSVTLCALFSYPFHTSSVLINVVFFLAILSHKLPGSLSLKLSKRNVMIILSCCFVGAAIFSFTEWRRQKALNAWEHAAHTVLTEGYPEASIFYNKAKGELENEGTFLYNYGAETYIAGFYNDGLSLLERSTKYYSSSDLYTYLGDANKMVKKYQNAEAAYRIAENVHPAKYLPKMQLLRLYRLWGKDDRAIDMAKEIVDFPVKIPSQRVADYKREAHDFLYDKNLK